ncbi:hypothetical protein LP414_29900 [Polaromonas sp. P1(28)-13]|nr:hypothetical protein LP414_29900 [Polaromonas sp. P1(28)-13]
MNDRRYLAITRKQWQEMALLVLAITSFVLQVIAAIRSYRENQVVANPQGWLARHHQSGLYELFCDYQANEHYEEPTTGLMYRLWRIRVYCRGFLSRN